MTEAFKITEEQFEAAQRETQRLCHELDIANADHVVLWLETQISDGASPTYMACRILDAHEAALAKAKAQVSA